MEPKEQSFQKVGRYELIRKIATGGMAELFLARFTGPGGFEKRCAVKRILPQFAEDEEFTRMFLNEARVAAMFDHPNIAQIFELGTDEATGQLFIAMELITGMDLRGLMRLSRDRGQEVPAELAAFMMTQALDGLAYAHEFRDPDGHPMHLVHRDVSPQNILVSFDGAIKVVDFGIVKANTQEGHTQTGMLKGKIAYMSPEQASGEHLDGRSDVFAIGVCLYELITGVKPFRATTEIMTLKAILENDPQPITHFVPDCPIGIENAVYRSLMKRREDRFSSAREFQLELVRVLRSCPVPLDRHVLSEFVRSLPESDSGRFDSTVLKIPRAAGAEPQKSQAPSPTVPAPPPGGAHDEAWREEAAKAFRAALDGPPRPRTSVAPTGGIQSTGRLPPADDFPRAGSLTGGRPAQAAPAQPMASPLGVTTDSGIFARAVMEKDDSVARAAGIGGKLPLPLVLGGVGVLLAAVIAFFIVRSEERPEVVPMPVEVAAKTPAPTLKPSPSPTASAAAASPTPEKSPPPSPSASAAPIASAPPSPSPSPSKVERERPERERHPDGPGQEKKGEKHGGERAAGSAGRLTLATTPRGLTVKLGEKTLGTTPLESIDVPPGKHNLTLSNAKLGIMKIVSIEVKKDQLTTQTVAIGKSVLKVNSRPWADVFVDGQSVGKTPVQRPVYEGRHEVKLVNPESGERIQIIEVGANEEREVKVKF
ncbi:MAG: serine/threonine-protein kinase [Myxococcota bacterium]